MDILLKNANLIDENGDVAVAKDLLIKDGIIAQIGENISAENRQITDCTGKFITPGFACLHAHSPMNIFKGIAEDVNIDDWFNKELWPYESKMQDEDIYRGAKLACLEMINNGLTVFADHYFKSDLIAKACKETGIKADIAYTIFGFGGDCRRELRAAEKFCKDFANDDMIKPRMGPHSPYICSPQVLKQINDKAKELGCGIHIHCSETAVQVAQSKENFSGKTPVQVIAEAGGFDVECILAHGLWMEDEDLKYLNEKTCVPASPKTYMKLGMGKGSLWKNAGKINLVIGNDGSASSNSIDVLEQVRLLGLVGKFEDNAEDFTLKQLWKYLMDGHKYLHFNSGKLKIGYSADLNVFDLNSAACAPVYNPLASIIYSANAASDIVHVLINGKFVKKDGKLLSDINRAVSHAQSCAKNIYERGKGQAKIYF